MKQLKGLLKTEDWLAVWLEFFIIALVLVGVRPQVPAFKWATDGEFKATAIGLKPKLDKLISDVETKAEADFLIATKALKAAIETGGDREAIRSAARKLGNTIKTAKVSSLKKKGGDISKKLGEEAGALVSKVLSSENILKSIYIGVTYLILTAIGIALMGGQVVTFILGFPVVFALAWISQFIAGNVTLNYWGLEYVIFALLIGLFISNVLGVPNWLNEAVRTEYYIKTGLVILGTGILFLRFFRPGQLTLFKLF